MNLVRTFAPNSKTKLMKKFLCSLLAIGTLAANAQDNDYKKSPTLTVNFSAFDFKTASAIRSSSLSSVLNNKKWNKLKTMDIGFGLSYLKGITNNIDFVGSLNGAFTKYPFRDKAAPTNSALLLEGDAAVNIKLLTDNYVVVPYLTAGIGVSRYPTVWGAYTPLGAGIQVKIAKENFVFINAQYRIPVTENENYHFFYSVGVGGPLFDKKEAPVAKPLPPIPPVEVAPPAPKDTDGDGIIDDNDKCPTVPGLAKYQGCPIPDTDGDGINDENDKCPNVPGTAKYQGCPVPDTDGDGLNDEMDKCPTEAGPASNNGCPIPKPKVTEEMTTKVNMAAKNIFFATGKATLLAKSFPALDQVIAVLKENETVNLEIDGYTDNTGSLKINQTLSQNRANSVMNYIVKKGISKDRLTAKGFGPADPIATNKTAAGRAQNRRVVMKLAE